MEYKFPNGFYWGAATSSHQIEGDNHNDWTEWETSKSRVESLKLKGLNPDDFISGKACDSYNRYEEDFDIAKSLGHNIHRFSIEWSRIEPEEGKFDFDAMKHYIGLVKAIRERGMEPMVTLWHFTNPIWFSKLGGFLNKKSSVYFTRYARYVVDNLKSDVGLWITFNEAASVYAGFSYMSGQWPPQHRNIFEYQKARKNFIESHVLAYQEIKRIFSSPNVSQDKSSSTLTSHNVEVGLVESNTYSAHGNRWHEKILGRLYNYQRNLYFWDKALPYYDFLGLNYYHVDRRVPGSYRVLPRQEIMPAMDWEIYPEGIYHLLMQMRKLRKPIYITENGIADITDKKRIKFIKDHLYWVWKAIQNGIDVRGYIYWSLLDNFEWSKGFGPRFGLVEVDYKTFERKIRPSAYEYKKICETNILKI